MIHYTKHLNSVIQNKDMNLSYGNKRTMKKMAIGFASSQMFCGFQTASLRKIPLIVINAILTAMQQGRKQDFMHFMKGRIRHSNSTLMHLMQGTTTQMLPKDRNAKTRPQKRDNGMPKRAVRVRYKNHFDFV